MIYNVLADIISSNTKVMLPETQAGMTDSVSSTKLLLVLGMDWKVAHCVRHCQSIIPRSLPEAMQEKELIQAWQETNLIVSSDTVSSSHQRWSKDDNAILAACFKDVNKYPMKGQLKSKMEESQQLKEVVQRNKFEKVYQ